MLGVAVVGMLVLIVASELYMSGEGGRMQISKTEFQEKSLRVHKILEDVSLQDVWVFRLSTGNGTHKLRDSVSYGRKIGLRTLVRSLHNCSSFATLWAIY